MTERQRESSGALLVASIIRNLGNKTWLSGVSDVVQAMDDPQRFLPSLLGRLGGSIAVPTGVAQIARTMDPVQRDAREPTFSTEGVLPDFLRAIADPMLARIQSRLPGVSSSLPARRDVWGENVVSEGGVGPDIASPIWTRTARNDALTGDLLESGISIGRPSRTIRGQRLNARQYGEYQALSGRYIRADLLEARNGPDWAGMDALERRRLVDRVKREARADARADLGLYGSDDDEEPGVRPGGAMPTTTVPPLPPGFQLER